MPYSNMCSYNFVPEYNNQDSKKIDFNTIYKTNDNTNYNVNSVNNGSQTRSPDNNDLFSISEDRLEIFGISINIDDLIILIMLFFMFRENNIDYSIIIILALILFDQS